MHFYKAVFSILICALSISSCKTNQKTNGEKTGRWIYKDSILDAVLLSKGRFKHGIEKGTWREYSTNKIVSKKKYKGTICYTTDFHSNRRVKARGISKLEIDSTTIHWFLHGEWKFYNEKGLYIGSKFYNSGTPIANTLDTII